MNAAALWLSIDLDYPTIGIVRVSNLPLVVAMAGVNQLLSFHVHRMQNAK